MKTGIYGGMLGHGACVHVIGVAYALDTGESVAVFQTESGEMMTESIEKFERSYTLVREVVDHRMSVRQLLEAKG